MQSAVRGVLVAAFRRLIRLYFRRIERVGEAPARDTRGRVVVANHHNALIDPVLVITDAACALAPVAKSTLWDIPGLRWLLAGAGAVPIVRRVDTPDKSGESNSAVFDQVAAHLAGGGNILIFPEGTSHSAPHLAPLRSGAARMLLAAEARAGVAPTFQACALEFDARTDFRSRALVLWGPVRRFADIAGATEEERVRAATDQMAADLGDLLVEGDTPDDRRRVARVAELLANEHPARTLEQWSGIGRQVELANRTLRDLAPTQLAEVAARVDAYYAALEELGLCDEDLVLGRTRSDTRALRRALTPLAAAGLVLYAAPYFLPRWLARRADPDAVSTFKLGAALVVYPVWMAGLVTAALIALPLPWSLAAAALAITSPFAALAWLDAWYQRPVATTPDQRASLAHLRTAARAAIDAARATLDLPR